MPSKTYKKSVHFNDKEITQLTTVKKLRCLSSSHFDQRRLPSASRLGGTIRYIIHSVLGDIDNLTEDIVRHTSDKRQGFEKLLFTDFCKAVRTKYRVRLLIPPLLCEITDKKTGKTAHLGNIDRSYNIAALRIQEEIDREQMAYYANGCEPFYY